MGPTYPSQPKICQLERMVMIHHCIAKSAFRAGSGVCLHVCCRITIVTALMSLMMHTTPTELLVLVQNTVPTISMYHHVNTTGKIKKNCYMSPSPWSQPL